MSDVFRSWEDSTVMKPGLLSGGGQDVLGADLCGPGPLRLCCARQGRASGPYAAPVSLGVPR